MIDPGTIQRIFDATDIVDVISDFVNLKKSGTNYKALSPFSNEKTPSFMVSPSKQIFKDFSSGIGGNAVSFLMEHEKLSYPEALKYLAKKYNIEIVEKEKTEEDVKQENERESMMVVTAFAQNYFTETLHHHSEGKALAMSYLKERGVREDLIEKFQVGYSLEKRDALTETARKKGYKLEYLVKAGLTIQKEEYRFDRFSGRIIFPIHSLSGKVIGFGGRILKKNDKTAKYLNSPESEIYHKSRILYGLFFAKKSIIKQDKCYLVEGYTDVIALHQVGFENVVASSGTALTQEQIRLIKRFTSNITIIYDGDEAGIKASFRGIDLVLEEGLNIKVLSLPDGEDPDSFSKKKSVSEFKEFIDQNEEDFITFKTKLLQDETGKDPVKRAGLINDIVKSVALIPDGITRSVYIRECSKILDMQEDFLYSETAKIRKKNAENQLRKDRYKVEQKLVKKPLTGSRMVDEDEILEKDIIRLLLNYGNYKLFIEKDPGNGNEKEISVIQYVIGELKNDELELSNPVYKEIFAAFLEHLEKESYLDERYFIHHQNDKIANIAADLLSSSYNLSKIWRRHENYIETEEMKLQEIVPETVVAYKNKKIMDALKDVQMNLRVAQEKKEEEKIMELQQKYIMLNNIKIALAKDLGERIIVR